jgi:hypothetical protein
MHLTCNALGSISLISLGFRKLAHMAIASACLVWLLFWGNHTQPPSTWSLHLSSRVLGSKPPLESLLLWRRGPSMRTVTGTNPGCCRKYIGWAKKKGAFAFFYYEPLKYLIFLIFSKHSLPRYWKTFWWISIDLPRILHIPQLFKKDAKILQWTWNIDFTVIFWKSFMTRCVRISW